MQKVVKDNIIYVDKPKMSLIPLALSAASLLFVAIGAASLFYFQKPLQQDQEARSAASVGNGQVILTSELTSKSIFASGTSSTIDLKYNSQGVQLTGIQIVTKVAANAETPTIDVPSNSNLQAIFQEVDQVSGGYIVSMIVTPKTLGQSFSSTSPVTFARLNVPLRAAGAITLTYDKANSFATVASTNPPKDELRTPEDVTFTIISTASPSPSPSVSPSPSPSPSASVSPTPTVSPTPSPSPTPKPSPTPNPLGDDFWLPSGNVYLKFLTDDSYRNQVAVNNLVPYRNYRVRVEYQVQNAKKSNTTDQSPIQTAFVLNGQGTSYVTNDLPYSLIANHADGAASNIETVFTALPDNNLRITTDARSAYAESNESNNVLILKFKAENGTGGSTTAGTCNKYCADSTECNAGFTCFYNQCRRPDNPDNSSCTAPTVTVVTSVAKSCNTGCSTNKDCSANLRCYQGACRLATNPSSFTCSAATAGVITKGTGTSLAGEKGEVIPVPTESPTSSLYPSSSPYASIRPSTKPVSSPTIVGTKTQGTETANVDATNSFWANFLASMQAKGISIPVIAVVIGLILFVLALIFAILGRTNNKPPMVVAPRKEAPKSVYEDDLQRKINSLKTQSAQSSTATAVTPTPVTPPVAPATPVAQESNSGMMSRLRDRGVLDHMPQAEKTPPETPTSV